MDAYKYIVSRAAAEWIVEYTKLYKMIKSFCFFTGVYDYDLDNAMALILKQNDHQNRTLRVQYDNVMNEFGRSVSAQTAIRKHFRNTVGNHARFFSESLEREIRDLTVDHRQLQFTLLDVVHKHRDILSHLADV